MSTARTTTDPAAAIARAADLIAEAAALLAGAQAQVRAEARRGERSWYGTGDLDAVVDAVARQDDPEVPALAEQVRAAAEAIAYGR